MSLISMNICEMPLDQLIYCLLTQSISKLNIQIDKGFFLTLIKGFEIGMIKL